MAAAKPKQDEATAPARKAYDRDFYGWTLEQGALLRAGRLDEVDLENVAEEIESLAGGEFDKLVSFTRLVLLRMLKWEHQPNLSSRSWALSIDDHRNHARDVVDENPSLKPALKTHWRAATHLRGWRRCGRPASPDRSFPKPARSPGTRCRPSPTPKD